MRVEDLPMNALFMVPGTHTLYKKGTNYETECSATLLLPVPSRTTVHMLPKGYDVKDDVGPSTLRRYEKAYGREEA